MNKTAVRKGSDTKPSALKTDCLSSNLTFTISLLLDSLYLVFLKYKTGITVAIQHRGVVKAVTV